VGPAGQPTHSRTRVEYRVLSRAMATKTVTGGDDEEVDGWQGIEKVTDADGDWDWVLVSSDPKRMPLLGGGGGGVEELRKALEKESIAHGILRMEFHMDSEPFVKLVHISALMNSANQRELAKGRKVVEYMTKEFEKHGVSVTLPMLAPDECNLPNICDRLRILSPKDVNEISLESYRPRRETGNTSAGKKGAHFDVDDLEGDGGSKQRQKTKAYKVGDAVEVYSADKEQWLDDGHVILVLEEAGSYDTYKLPAGAIKVQYGGGKRFKWVLVNQIEKFLRPSQRPAPPAPMMGDLYKQTTNFVADWHVRHTEINMGFMQWWSKQDDARDGIKPKTVAALLGLEMKTTGTQFTISTASTKGEKFTFDATTAEGMRRWTRTLQKHAEYCEDLRKYLAEKHEEATAWPPKNPKLVASSNSRRPQLDDD